MRIGTWNLDRGRHSASVVAAQLREIERVGADVFVITEAPAALSCAQPGLVTSPALRSGKLGAEAWAAIRANGVVPVDLVSPYERLSVAAQAHVQGETVVIYGSVLPWRQAASQAPKLTSTPDETSAEMFVRLLAEQVADMRTLIRTYEGALVLWAGDFNQTLAGPNYGGSNANRKMLHDALDDLGMTAWNADAPHATPGMCAIDLICGPADRTPLGGVEVIHPRPSGPWLSDHAGYVIDL